MKYYGLGLLLLLTGCYGSGAEDAVWAKHFFIGKPIESAYACIGNPNSERKLRDGGLNSEWVVTESSSNLSAPISMLGTLPEATAVAAAASIPLSAFSGSISAPLGGGNGRLIIVSDKSQTILGIHFSGAADSLFERDGLIGRDFLRGCHRDSADRPAEEPVQ